MIEANVQSLLGKLGYTTEVPHGALREEPWRSALKKYQGDAGLQADGVYGPKTDAALQKLQIGLGSAPKEAVRLNRWRITNYYVADEGSHAGPLVSVLSPTGAVLAKLSAGDFASAALEGTVKLKDGRLLNVTGDRVKVAANAYDPVLAIAYKNNWVPSKPGYAGLVLDANLKVVAVSAFEEVPKDKIGDGYGIVRGVPMKPYRTLAADIGAYKTSEPRFTGQGGVCPPGTEMFILEFVGKICPDGKGGRFIHDGWFVVNDTGGGIFGAHVDIFSGSYQMAIDVPHPNIAHVWFKGTDHGKPFVSENRLAADYTYGL